MSPIIRGPNRPETAGMQLASRNPSHFRSGRRWIGAEGVVLVALGVWGFIAALSAPEWGPTGVPVLLLRLTPWHSGLLLTIGLITIISTLRRRPAVIVTGAATLVFLLLVFYGAVAAAHSAPGPLGLDNRDIILHGAIAAVNLGLLYWLLPDVLDGPVWLRRPGSQKKEPNP